MNSNTYYIFRHGETFASKAGNISYGDKEFTAEILPEGIEAVKKIGEYLKNIKTDYFYTSELLRCVQTAQIIKEITKKRFEKDRKLNEKFEPTFDEFKKRMLWVSQKLERARNTTYLICTHGAIISALKHLLTTARYEEKDLMDFPAPGTLMIINFKGVKILDFN